MSLKSINSAELVPLDIFTSLYPIAIDLVYANEKHPENIFGAVYRPDARLWLHRDFTAVVLLASLICSGKKPGIRFQAKDGLRTVEAQTLMSQSEAVRKNPHWIDDSDQLLSPPGKGAHPRAMAIDVVLIDENGGQLEMGTPFDFLSKDRYNNPAARDYEAISQKAKDNRDLLESSMMEAAHKLGMPLLPLPSEWWDFRFSQSVTDDYGPLWDADLPGQMRMTKLCGTAPLFPDYAEKHFESLKNRITETVSHHLG